MKFLLAAVNAKYIHSNPGVYSLKKYADEKSENKSAAQIEIGEYTINHQVDDILKDIYRRSPDVAGFSCYIWNILYVKEIIRDLKKVMPSVRIWLGGPEVSYHSQEMLEELPEADGIMTGEGEESFYQLTCAYERAGEAGGSVLPDLESISGLVYREPDGKIRQNASSELLDLSEIPFYYGDLSGLEHRIIYYESSRGCPFSCSYCLSSIDKTVRFRNLCLVKDELQYFLDRKVPQVKFVDRTFNCKKSHAVEIWRFIRDHDNGVTNFHFEISADLLDEEELYLMEDMRPGLIQLEIGVQTTNPDTIREIRRSTDLKKLEEAVARINSSGNIHQHLDLIAGLPYEDLDSFRNSFNDVYAMNPEQLQLGFLKVLKGSYMEEMAKQYGLLYKSLPPYEVLSTKWLDFEGILLLKGVEEMVEIYYNSGQFKNTVKRLVMEFSSSFELYVQLAEFYRRRELETVSHSRLARYEILYEFILEALQPEGGERECAATSDIEEYRDFLMYDLYLRENLKSRPFFARDQSSYKEKIRQFYIAEAETPVYLRGYETYDSRQISKMTHIEVMRDGVMVLFDYQNREALHHNADAFRISE